MKDNSFYIPVEMEALPEIKNKIDFYVEEKFDFAHAETPKEDATLTIKKNDVTIANFRASDKFDTTANITVPTKTSDLLNDSGYIVGADVPSHETDPTVPVWAKAQSKPTYTAVEVHALPDTTVIPSTTSQLTNDSGFITSASLPTKVSDLTNDSGFIVGADVPNNETDPTVPQWAKQPDKPIYTASEVHALSDSTVIPSTTSQLTNDSGFISTELDPTVPAWAKSSTKPTYTASEVGALPNTTVIPTVPTNVSAFTNDSGYITANDVPVKSVNGKTGEVIVDRVTRISENLDSTYMISVESVSQSEYSFKSYMVGGTKTLSYTNNKIYEDMHFEQEANFPGTIAIYMLDYMGWAVQLINFSDVITSQEIKLYKLCKLNLSEISENIYYSAISSIEFTASDGSTLIWHSNGEVETL